jgi:zinc D-Ala-D-Ala carboxypeptidase
MTPHFSNAELACKCGCGMLPQRDFMDKVERLRVKCGFPLPVTCGARCTKHNDSVSHTGTDGPHTTGRAIDFGVQGQQALQVIRYALELGFTGIGLNQKGAGRFVHIDDLPNTMGQPRPWCWSY